MKFEIKDRDAAGRIGKFTTKHGTVTTPNLMPVINPNKKIISPKEMKKLFGTEIVITNSYIIKKDKNLKERAIKKGLHRLIDFDGPIMTDSGTFQSYVYGDVEVKPSEIVEFQKDIGSDIGTILDVFGTPDQTRDEAEKGMLETLKRAEESIKVKGDMNLACTVQGSIFPDLRKKCADELSSTGCDFFPIGGVVPLMEDQKYSDLTNVIIASKKGLSHDKPVHLFGAGHPIIFPLAVALGCDFFDSSSYVKYAVDDRLIFPWGTEKLNNLTELPCCCPICSEYSASDLKKMDKKQRNILLAKHNLFVCFSEIRKIRNAITQGNLWELVERRADCNPYLKQALKILRKKENKEWLEKFEPTSKNKALFYTGSHTIHRPIIYRYQNRLIENFDRFHKEIILFPESEKPYSKYYSEILEKTIKEKLCVNLLVDSYIGPVPFELDEMYPLAQSVFPEDVDKETLDEKNKFLEKSTKKTKIYFWDEKSDFFSKIKKSDDQKIDFDVKRVLMVADMQFGNNAGDLFFKDKNVDFVKSKKTGKIRNILVDNKHVLSMRAGDGMFTLKIEGAKILHRNLKSPNLRVIIDDDAVPFVKEGKSVFAKFVKDCDPKLRPGDECLVVDKNNNLLAVGRCIMNRDEMLCFNYGVAIKNRESKK